MCKYFLLLIAGWTIIIAGALLINVSILHKNWETFEQAKSRAVYQILAATHQWNANHGILYVPITHVTHPDPYLTDARRDVMTNYGDSLTLINPTLMIQQVSKLMSPTEQINFHITSLDSIHVDGRADEWETKVLQTYTHDPAEHFEKTKHGDTIVFRYMAPLTMSQSCLSCHETQGHKLENVQGGISVSVAYDKHDRAAAVLSLNKVLVIYVVLYLIGLFVILYFRSVASRQHLDIANKNAALQDASIANDKFFSIVAHDLKTPAANITFLSETLKKRFTELNPTEQKHYVDLLVESAKTHHNLLNDLLDLSRLRTGNIQYNPKAINVKAISEEVLEQTKLQAQQKEIRQINRAGGCIAEADERMVATVIRNLVVNAIKFTPLGGQVIVDVTCHHQEVLVSVTDTGIGISQEAADRIFDVGYYDKSTLGTTQEQGTGLGLSLCKEFVERNNGKIWLESKIGVGTTFFFTLPAFNNGKGTQDDMSQS